MKRYLRWWEKILLMLALLVCFVLLGVGVYAVIHILHQGGGNRNVMVLVLLIATFLLYMSQRGDK